MNRVYPKYVQRVMEAFHTPNAPPAAPTIYFYALNDSYVFNEAHHVLADLPVLARIQKSKAAAGLTVVNGIFDLADLTDAFTGLDVAGTTKIVAVAEWGVSDSQLIFHMDTWENMANPLTNDGGKIDFVWSASGIFQLYRLVG